MTKDRLVQVQLASGVTVTAERTLNSQLVVAPTANEEGLRGDFALVHVPTGLRLPELTWHNRVENYLELASRVAHLDWWFNDPDSIPPGVKEGFQEIRADYERELDKPGPPKAMPEGWGEDGKHDAPRDADSMIRWLLQSVAAQGERLFGAENENSIPLRSGDGTNYRWMLHCSMWSKNMNLVYLLAALQRTNPAVADNVSAWMASEWFRGGETLPDLCAEWSEQVERGEPLSLPAVPSPDSELLTQ